MAIQQISVFLENKEGKLAEAIKAISGANVNIRALCVADTRDFGILRLITSDADKTIEVLSKENIINTTVVVAAKLEDRVGSLYYVLDILAKAGINLEYIYAFTASEDFGAYVVLRVDDAEKAECVLREKGVSTLNEDDIKDI